MQKSFIYIILLCMFACTASLSNTINSQHILEGKDMEQYEHIFRKKFLAELANNGYNQGYDFNLADVTVEESKGYNVPRIIGVLSYEGNVIYIPQGVEFENIFELSMILSIEGIKFSSRDRGTPMHYLANPSDESDSNVELPSTDPFTNLQPIKKDTIVRKGPYPGINYFTNEMAAIEKSFNKHKPVLVIDGRFKREINLASGHDAVLNKSPTIYQVSDNVIQIVFVYDASSQIDFGFKFHYDLNSGKVYNVRSLSPPALM